MRHGSSNRRSRGRGGSGRKSGQQRSQVFDSNGPDVRIRGTAYQVTEKYLALAKDAAAAGDRILEESYLQHAEHYQRVINSWGLEQRPAPQKQDTAMTTDGNSKTQEQPAEKAKTKAPEVEDLSLPTSILGADAVKSDSETRTQERTAEPEFAD